MEIKEQFLSESALFENFQHPIDKAMLSVIFAGVSASPKPNSHILAGI